MNLKLSIIIVTYNSGAFIGPCLESLRRACSSLAAELIIVDNGSSDDTLAEALRCWPEARLLRNRTNRGFAAANNQGAKVATGEYLLLLNADTEQLDEHLTSALHYAEQHQIAVLGPQMLGTDGKPQWTWDIKNTVASYMDDIVSLTTFRPRILGRKREMPAAPMPVRFLIGAALLIARAAYERHGLFDERFFFCCEERDLCYRYAQAGQSQVFYPYWVIRHHGSGGQTVSRFHLENWIRASLKLVAKNGSHVQRCLIGPLFGLFLASYTAASGLKWAFRREPLQLRATRLYAQMLWRLPRLVLSRVSAAND
jgi:GT2 family glycosyltransferase